MSVVFKQGTTKLGCIQLGEGAKVEVDAMDVDISAPARLELSGGICASETSKPADRIRFTNNIILAIGTEGSYAEKAFSGIKNVHLENYEFHSRGTINTLIYATTAFDEVESIDIYCSKVQVNATTLFARTDNTTDCIVHTEGQIQLKGNIGKGKLKSNYYSSYPNGAVSRDEMDGSCNIPDYMTTYDITADDMSNGITESNNRGCTLVNNNNDSITLTSTDPILYSVSYQVDDGINVPNTTCGEITMNGFEKGFYTVDGTNGRFEAWIAAGETVNVTILPHKGYQYQKDTLNINGQVISNATAGEARGTLSTAIAYSKAEGTTSGGGSTSGSISGSSSSSPSWSGSSGASTPKTETKTDGSKVETTTETKTDGSQTETKKETTENKAGKEIQKTVQTQKDKNGQVTGSSEVSVIEKADAKTSVTVNVSKDAKGNVTDAKADVDTVGKTSGKDYELLTTKEEAAVSKAILATVKVKKSTATIQQGKSMTVQFSNKLNMENVSKITYTSSKKSVAVVNKNGTVTAKDTGKVTIKANVLLRNGKTKVVKMTVRVP